MYLINKDNNLKNNFFLAENKNKFSLHTKMSDCVCVCVCAHIMERE
jgi:hypothetical protein